jgi:hypothetical protein
MSDKGNLTLIWWLQFGVLFFAFFGFISVTDEGFTCCTTCLILYFLLSAWKKQISKRMIDEKQVVYNKSLWENKLDQARTYENQLDYDHALSLYRELNMTEDIRRINQAKYNIRGERESGGSTTIIHGNYVDDRETVVKDSVLNRSNIGGSGTSKIDELEKASALKEKGLINDEEYEQMKKEILEK